MKLGGKTCLVTGANGFVGSHLARMLVEAGADVRALVRKTSDRTLLEGSGAREVYGDITDPPSLEAVAGCDLVFHVAGVVKALSDDTYERVNGGGTENVCAALRAHAPKLERLVLVSSIAAAGPSQPGHPRTEADEDAPVSIYGRSKLSGERAVKALDAVPWTIVRPPMVYGPGDTATLDLFTSLKRHLRARLTGGPRELSHVYVTDLCAGLMVAATHPAAVGETFYVCHPEPVTFEALQDCILKALGTWAVTVPVPAVFLPWVGGLADWMSRRRGKPMIMSRQKVAEALPKAWVFSPAKAREWLGFEAKTELVDGIRMQTDWFREHGWL